MVRIDYVYSAHSAYAYLGSRRLSEICASHDVELVHRPVLLSPVVEAQGSLPFAARTQPHVDYFFGREIERWAEYRDVPIISYRPTHHDADYRIATGMLTAAGPTGAGVDALAHAMLEAHWKDDADLSDVSALRAMAQSVWLDDHALVEAATSPAVQQTIEENIAWAIANAVFGSPTYVVDGDPFYGQDRLELVERAVRQPFAPPNWSNPPVD